MAITYCWFIKVRLWKSKKTNISPTIARNIPTAVRIANQTRRTVPVRIATALNKYTGCACTLIQSYQRKYSILTASSCHEIILCVAFLVIYCDPKDNKCFEACKISSQVKPGY